MGTTTPTTASAPQRMLLVAGAAIVILIIATAVIAALRAPTMFEAGTPEATVQAYVQAMIDGDEDAAADLLDPDMDCDAGDLADAHVGADVRVTLRNAEIDGASAEVEVGVTVVYGDGPFDTNEYDDTHRFELIQTEAGWLITERPWPYASCWR